MLKLYQYHAKIFLIHNQNHIRKKFLVKQSLKYQLKQHQQIAGKNMLEQEGLTFGIDTFGKSAPYKEIYKHFGLTAENISKKTKNLIKRLNMTDKSWN